MAAASFDKMSLDYVMVAAVDFGTTFSGYAFSFKSDKNKIFMNKSWGQNVGFMSYKTPTCLLVNGANQFVAFGYEAEDRYAGVQETDSDDEDGPEEYHLFRHFKMMLHGDKKLTKSKRISSLDGKILPALDVFSMSLEYLKDHLLEAVSQALEGSVDVKQIRWVITVPAIWREEAKQFMREAAFKAGIISAKDSKQLLIALEPEAASIFCRSLDLNHFIGESGKDTKPKFKTGTKYLVIDAGGGTIDLTAHEVLMITGKVKEIHTASGGAWGGTKVDDNFVKLLEKVLGRNFINAFRNQCPQQWLLFMVNFERMKRAMKPDGKSKINLQIPLVLATKYQEICAKSLEKNIKEKAKPGVSFSNGSLVIKHDVVLQLFNPVISNIVAHIEQLLKVPDMRSLQFFLLVGGFAESALLQKAIKDRFGAMFSVLVPEEAQMSVIKGAVLFGHNPDDIHVRKIRYTYGIRFTPTFNPEIHDAKYKQISRDEEVCKLIHVYAMRNEAVDVGKTIKNIHTPKRKDQTAMTLAIYQSDNEQAKYVKETGCKKLGTFKVQMPNTDKGLEREVEVEMTFGGTEIQVRAHDVESGTKAEIVVDFLGD